MSTYSTETYLLDRANIHDTILRLYHHTDRRELHLLPQILAPEVILDYTAMFGGEPSTVTPEQVIERFQPMLSKMSGMQHVFASMLIHLPQPGSCKAEDVTKASVDANAIVNLIRQEYAEKGGERTSNGGWGQLEVVKLDVQDGGNPWRISKLKANPLWMAGNVKVLMDD